jgi:hypothetical protein
VGYRFRAWVDVASLSHAKSRKYPTKEIIRSKGPRDFAKGALGVLKIECNQLRAMVV